jgi:hypothetical protein
MQIFGDIGLTVRILSLIVRAKGTHGPREFPLKLEFPPTVGRKGGQPPVKFKILPKICARDGYRFAPIKKTTIQMLQTIESFNSENLIECEV